MPTCNEEDTESFKIISSNNIQIQTQQCYKNKEIKKLSLHGEHTQF